MPHYMFQGRYSSAALKAMVNSPHDREGPARELVESVGGKLHSLFLCFGSEDFVAIIEMPDDKAAAACSLVIGASGAFSAGATTKLMTTADAVDAMKIAKKSSKKYKAPTG